MLADLMMNYSFESTKKKASKPVLGELDNCLILV